jgi:hypothetical protein
MDWMSPTDSSGRILDWRRRWDGVCCIPQDLLHERAQLRLCKRKVMGQSSKYHGRIRSGVPLETVRPQMIMLHGISATKKSGHALQYRTTLLRKVANERIRYSRIRYQSEVSSQCSTCA